MDFNGNRDEKELEKKLDKNYTHSTQRQRQPNFNVFV